MNVAQLQLRLVAGFVIVFFFTYVLDKAGNFLYHRGIAKPFYLLGYRVHHRKVLLAFIPAAYTVVATMIYLHYMRVIWYSFWTSAEVTTLLVGACLALDLTLDALSSSEKRRALLHHEWVYFVVPAYVFTHMFVLV